MKITLTSTYLQVSWLARSLCPEGPLPRWRCSSCRASRGQSGPPRRWRWASPPGGWAQPSGQSPPPPALLTCRRRSPRMWFWPWSPAPRTCFWSFPSQWRRFARPCECASQSRLSLCCFSSGPWCQMLTLEVPTSWLKLHFTAGVLSSLLLSKALSFSFSAFCLVVGKKGPDNSALVSTSLLSSSPSLVAFSELRPFKYK